MIITSVFIVASNLLGVPQVENYYNKLEKPETTKV